MKRVRVIPVLLIKNGGLYKSVKFSDYKYVGDPINAVRIFNEKEVDELVVLDMRATAESKPPNIEQIKQFAEEAFMPVAYGGGITTIEQVKQILYNGVEKVIFNYSAYNKPDLIAEAVGQFGSSSIVASIDYKKDWLGRVKVFVKNGKVNTGEDPLDFACRMEQLGVGEILLNSIDRDGTYKGYDTEMISKIAKKLSVPVVACGGASDISSFLHAVKAGASAVAAGSLFVFQRPHNAVLISYPSIKDLTEKLYQKFS
jgi:imidazole glycerol-phosphate synthase subunit HisF